MADSLPLAELRIELLGLSIAAILLAAGISAEFLFFYRREARDRTLLFFGIAAILYAIRLLFDQRFFLVLTGTPQTVANHVKWLVTSTIALPLFAYLFLLADDKWKAWLRKALMIQLLLTALGILADLFGFGRRAVDVTNNIFVITAVIFVVSFFVSVARHGKLTRELRVVAAGVLIFGAFVLHANLLGLHVIRGRNLEAIGFLAFVSSLGYLAAHRTFTKEERLVAIQNELAIAKQIQSSILPRAVPSLQGLDIAAHYLPMGAVAGDFYDFVDAGEKHLGILVADVTGHGVPAALIASMLKVALSGQISRAADPAAVLTGLNQALCGKFEDHFVTAAYLFIDLEEQILRYAGAGHPPLFFIECIHGEVSAKVSEIEHNGLCLGIFPEAIYAATEWLYRPGDACLLYTDGLLEAADRSHEEFGKARCKQFLRTHAADPPSILTEKLIAELAEWSNSSGVSKQSSRSHIQSNTQNQSDDITLVAIKFTSH